MKTKQLMERPEVARLVQLLIQILTVPRPKAKAKAHATPRRGGARV